jgi:hypothetical protein
MTLLSQGQSNGSLLIRCNSHWPSLEAGLSIRTFYILFSRGSKLFVPYLHLARDDGFLMEINQPQ